MVAAARINIRLKPSWIFTPCTAPFKTVVVSDGNATGSDLLHTGALNGLFAMFADVMTSDEVLARLKTSTAHAAQHAAR